MRAPEKRHGVERLVPTNHVTRRGLARTRDPQLGIRVQPGEASILASAPGVNVSLLRSISGPLAVGEGGLTRICSSIVDASSCCGVAYAAADLASEGADLHIEDSTVIGTCPHYGNWLQTRSFLRAGPNMIHGSRLLCGGAGRKQAGCMRFCYVPADAITPRCYRCLPGDASQEAALRPQFVTLQYGHPSYALLSGAVPMAVWTGADNGSQMGTYKLLEETEAVRNVQLRAPEFLPFNMEAGVFLVPSAAVTVRSPLAGYGYGVPRNSNLCGDTEDELMYVAIRRSPPGVTPGKNQNGKERFMRGDFSRLRFEKTKHYTSVLEQQGRVALDADHNEQRAIDGHLHKTETGDIIGPFGGPGAVTTTASRLQSAEKQSRLAPGAITFRGSCVRTKRHCLTPAAPYLIHPAVSDSDLPTELASGSLDSIRLFLQVWERLVTSLDDPCLREPALGPADTTVRRQTVWRVIAKAIQATQPSPSPFPARTARARRLLEKASTLASVTPSLTIQPTRVVESIGTAVPGLTLPGTATAPGNTTSPGAAVPANCCAEMYQPATVPPSGGLSANHRRFVRVFMRTYTGSRLSWIGEPASPRGNPSGRQRIEGDVQMVAGKWFGAHRHLPGISGADVMVASLGLDANLGSAWPVG